MDLLVFDSHPIQYRSPIFRLLQQQLKSFLVVYSNPSFNGNRWWFREKNKIPIQKFGLLMEEGFHSHTLNLSQTNVFTFCKRLIKVFIEHSPRTILIFGYYLPENWFIWFLAPFFGAKIIYIGETISSKTCGFFNILKNVLLKSFFFRCHKIICIGVRSREVYQELNISSQKLVDGKYCVDNVFFSSGAAERIQSRHKIRSHLGIPQDAVVILFVGRLFSRKRPLDVLELHSKCFDLNVHTLMVGNGDLEDEIKKEGKRLSKFHFLGFKNQAELKELYGACDILYVPSEFETWGLVINECFCMGMTAIVTRECGAAFDLVINGETGFITEVGEVDAAFNHVVECYQDPNFLSRLKHNAQEKVVSTFTPEAFAKVIIEATSDL